MRDDAVSSDSALLTMTDVPSESSAITRTRTHDTSIFIYERTSNHLRTDQTTFGRGEVAICTELGRLFHYLSNKKEARQEIPNSEQSLNYAFDLSASTDNGTLLF